MRVAKSAILALLSFGFASLRAAVIYDTVPPVTTLNPSGANDAPSNAQSRLASPAGKIAILITITDGRTETVQF